jgi:hypothetical protein
VEPLEANKSKKLPDEEQVQKQVTDFTAKTSS